MKKHLTFKQKILVAGTLFGMFFGAGNLIFPVHLGQAAGSQLAPATLGLVVTYGFYSVSALISFFLVQAWVKETRGRELEDMG